MPRQMRSLGSTGAVCQGSSVKASVEGASGSRQPLTQGRVLPARQIEFRQTPPRVAMD